MGQLKDISSLRKSFLTQLHQINSNVLLNTVKFYFKALGLYNSIRGFGRAYKRGGAYIRVGL